LKAAQVLPVNRVDYLLNHQVNAFVPLAIFEPFARKNSTLLICFCIKAHQTGLATSGFRANLSKLTEFSRAA